MRFKASLITALLTATLLAAPIHQANAGCRDFPESTTPVCVAQNLAEEQTRQANEAARQEQIQLDATNAAKTQAEQQFIESGSRPCSLFPASITPACVAKNLDYEKERLGIYEKKQLADLEKAIKAEAAQQKADYIRNGSRPCSLYPASITAECAAQNLAFEEVKKVESAALAEAKAASVKSSFTTLDDNGSLLVQAKISTKVDLLSTKVKLLDSKGKVVDSGVIRYLSSGEPYIVFDNFTGSGNYKVQLSLPNKKFSTISIKVAK